MIHRYFSKFAAKSSGCCNQQHNIIRISSYFFSSTSATSSPKFPILPQYNGKSEPMPKSIIPLSSQLDVANAIRPSFNAQTPLLLPNLLSNCDAIHFWKSLEYWKLAVGEDTPIEVEVGKGYNRGSERVTMMFGEYLNYLTLCMEHENKEYEEYQKTGEIEQQQTDLEVAYLAQNEMFPQVINDIKIPEFCDDAKYTVGEGKLYHSMLWMGPRHSLSPLHYDPLDNLLMQICGYKRVLLFPPDKEDDDEEDEKELDDKERMARMMKRATQTKIDDEQTWHYAGAGKDGQYNTSAVDIENPDVEKFPNFKAAPIPYQCILGPGDVLYIPSKWWHHVRSLEFSVSANAWWR